MKIVFEHTSDRKGCDALEHFQENRKFLDHFPVEVEILKVQGAGYAQIRCHINGEMRTFPVLRLDLLSDFVKNHFQDID